MKQLLIYKVNVFNDQVLIEQQKANQFSDFSTILAVFVHFWATFNNVKGHGSSEYFVIIVTSQLKIVLYFLYFRTEIVCCWLFLFTEFCKAITFKVRAITLSKLFIKVWCLAIFDSSYICSNMNVVPKLIIVDFFFLTAIQENVKLFHLFFTFFEKIELNFKSREPVLILHFVLWLKVITIIFTLLSITHKFSRTEYIVFPLEHHNAIEYEVAHAEKGPSIKHESTYYLSLDEEIIVFTKQVHLELRPLLLYFFYLRFDLDFFFLYFITKHIH